MLQTFWMSSNIIAYATSVKIFFKELYQTFQRLNLKAEDYRHLTKLWNFSSLNASVGGVLLLYVSKGYKIFEANSIFHVE